jgi:hypothetical protein
VTFLSEAVLAAVALASVILAAADPVGRLILLIAAKIQIIKVITKECEAAQ